MATPTPSLASRAARDPALLRKALANPGLRSKLPASMLTVAQRRSRTNAVAAKAATATTAALSDPTTPLSGANLIGAANSIVGGQYDPQIAGLAREGGLAQLQGSQAIKRTRGIYDNIAKYQTSALNQQNASQQSTAGDIAGITSGALGQVDLAGAQQRAQVAKDAEVRGAGLDGGSLDALAGRIASAKDSITQRGQIAGNEQAANAQTNNAVLGGIGAATQQRGGEQAGNIQTRTDNTLKDLSSRRQTLQGQRGSDFVKTVLALRQRAGDEYIAEAGLNLKGAVANQNDKRKRAEDAARPVAAAKVADAKVAAATATGKAAERRWGRTLNKYGVSQAAWYQWGKQGPKGIAKRDAAIAASKAKGKGSTKSPFVAPAAQNVARDQISGALPIVRRYLDANPPTSTGEIRRALLSGVPADKKAGTPGVKPIPKDYVNAVMDIILRGGISPANVIALKRRRLDVKRLGFKILPPGSAVTSGGALGGAVQSVAGSVQNALGG